MEKPLVDQSSLNTAQQLAQFATTHDERPLAQEALRLGGFRCGHCFPKRDSAGAAASSPLSAEARECKERQQKAETGPAVGAGACQGAFRATGESAISPSRMQLQADLIQAEADIELAQDEVEDAKHDLLRAGGDPVGRIQALKQGARAGHSRYFVCSFWSRGSRSGRVDSSCGAVAHSASEADAIVASQSGYGGELARLVAKHNAFDAQIDSEKSSVPQLAHHSKKNKTGSGSAGVPSASQTPDGHHKLAQENAGHCGESESSLGL